MRSVLLAGATGSLGRLVHGRLLAYGDSVRPLLRSANMDLTDPASLEGVCQDIDVVISCAGASMNLYSRERASFTKVDFGGNCNLLAEAKRAGVKKFVYVSLFGAHGLLQTEYAKAHEQFVRELADSGLPYTIVRPTGFFSMFNQILAMAAKGRGITFGDGSARTNPIHHADVAEACVDAITQDLLEIPIGGPDTFTRKEIVEMAFQVVRRPPAIKAVPLIVIKAACPVVNLINPRVAALVRFALEISTVDCVAPTYGRQHLLRYFQERHSPAYA